MLRFGFLWVRLKGDEVWCHDHSVRACIWLDGGGVVQELRLTGTA